MYYVYILHSEKDRGLYIGYTSDLKRRITEHKKGLTEATKHRLPIVLVHYEAFLQDANARAREKYLKSGYGREQLRSQLKKLYKILKLA
ncbi:MAG: excinuclease ABC subunit C [Candidatus Lloydbacteria bacterium RIFCSPHIGHO2_02_FULL_51_22]|uniref:Excinuclease ABC subunit C n=2 Tax=Candidatus Lloydiibacteriota TaxID=1817910 RepID=A0A1G2D7C0_9BACT|nr:MAG: excinuclease ABC subunit C [Candidatus Lloydbacteria bacterium RIFCSPHIGHO2_02_FULL_51_22]OGZ15280.1 MAG: excinuclease ABC subunit C [Candidatus Lloydbacteria bacterium RIFCSPLOWO2_02_FULL_51_11]